jgi:hypothetical protein
MGGPAGTELLQPIKVQIKAQDQDQVAGQVCYEIIEQATAGCSSLMAWLVPLPRNFGADDLIEAVGDLPVWHSRSQLKVHHE